MRVVFPFVGDSVGGSHHSVIELYKELHKADIVTPIIVVHSKGDLSLFLDDVGIAYEYLPIQKFAGENPGVISIISGIFLNAIKIYKYINLNKVHIVHGNDLRINLTWSLITKFSRASYVWHQRSAMSSSIRWRFSNFLADHFITISHYVDQSLPKNIEKINKTMVLNPFNISDLHDRCKSREQINRLYRIPEKVILVGYIGRLIDWKNVDFLIECFSAYALKVNSNIHLMIVGGGKEEFVNNLKQLTYKLEINEKVTFLGFSSQPTKIMSVFDLMVAPSNKEPFGRTIIEAMIQKTPVLAARGGGHLETIKHEETGWLYKHKDIDDFITQVERILTARKTTKDVIQKSYEYACSEYSSTIHVGRVMAIYKKI